MARIQDKGIPSDKQRSATLCNFCNMILQIVFEYALPADKKRDTV